MNPESSDEIPLPSFRRDLKIFKGPDEPDGSPTFNLFDPIKAQYYRFTWAESEIIKNAVPNIRLSQLVDRINSNSTLRVSKEELTQFYNMAFQLGLLEQNKPSETLIMEKEKTTQSLFTKILHNYLYFRIPLLNPDKFLTKTLKYVRPLVSWPAFILYIVLSLLGLFFLAFQFERYVNTFGYFFNFEGLIIYGATLFVVKIIHEFSHAYTAKFYKLHVPTMGAAIILLYPVMYTDVTDGWKLRNRKHRMAISIAGVTSEIIIAGISTLGWALTEPGLLHSMFFVLSSITLLSSLLVNINPMMRFDGYYMLSDLWGIDNLQSRSFEVARWKLREWLLGFKLPPPEENLSEERITGMVAYSVATWIYRLFLYTAIALFVYYQFTKSLGIFLFMLEVIIFFIWPVVWEIQALKARWPYFKRNTRASVTAGVIAIIAAWFIVPLPHTLTFPAIVIAEEEQNLFSPIEGMVSSVHIKRGDLVKKDQLILEVTDPKLVYEKAFTQAKKSQAEAEYQVSISKEDSRPFLSESQAEIETQSQKLNEITNKIDSGKVKALIEGKISLWDTTLKPGTYVGRDQPIGKIATENKLQVLALVPEREIVALSDNKEVQFHITLPPETLHGKVIRLNPNRLSQLKHQALASIYHGDIPTTEDKKTGKMKVVPTYYPVLIELEQAPVQPRIGQTGTIRVVGPWRSLAWEGIKNVLNLFWRESGF